MKTVEQQRRKAWMLPIQETEKLELLGRSVEV